MSKPETEAFYTDNTYVDQEYYDYDNKEDQNNNRLYTCTCEICKKQFLALDPYQSFCRNCEKD